MRRLLLLLVVSALGCAPTLVDARFAVDNAARTYEAVEPSLEKQRAAEGDACFLDMGPPGASAVQTCLDGVRARWKPVRTAVEAAQAAILAAQSTVGIAEAAATLGVRPDLARVFTVVLEAIGAAERLRDAVLELRKTSAAKPSSAATTSPRAPR